MEREFSAGGVIVRRMQDRWWLAAIEPQSSQPRRGTKTACVLALPKGLIDGRERPEEAAAREVREETGLEGRLITKLRDIKYFYVRSWGDKQRVFKIVSFYLLLYYAGRVNDIAPEMRHEVQRAEWVPLEDAVRRLTYPGEREVAAAAQEYLAAHPDVGTS